MSDAYFLQNPDQWRGPVVFASPHSGRIYPDDLLSRANLPLESLRSSEDAFVDSLYGAAARLGSGLLCAKVARAYVDLNRSCDELDPALIDGAVLRRHNLRVASGLGVIARVVAQGRAIYSGKLSHAEAMLRLQRYWYPYHEALSGLLRAQKERFGSAILIDCHSMPREAIGSAGEDRPEVVLGDRFGCSSSEHVVGVVEAAYRRAGFRVVRNRPFSGAYIMQAYGRPANGVHAVQVEIDRSLYMEERTLQPHSDFAVFCDRIAGVQAEIIGAFAQDLEHAAQ